MLLFPAPIDGTDLKGNAYIGSAWTGGWQDGPADVINGVPKELRQTAENDEIPTSQ